MIRLYLLGLKGLKVISKINDESVSLIGDVVVGKDNRVLNGR